LFQVNHLSIIRRIAQKFAKVVFLEDFMKTVERGINYRGSSQKEQKNSVIEPIKTGVIREQAASD